MLVVGGGPSRSRRSSGLLDCGADVTVVAPQFVAGARATLASSSIRRGYRELAISTAASSSSPRRRRRRVNRRVFADAEARALLCNVVDVPELCSFILPAVHREDPIAIAVSTGGASPALAQRLRDDFAARRPARARRRSRAGCASCGRGRSRTCRPTRSAATYFAGLVEEALG